MKRRLRLRLHLPKPSSSTVASALEDVAFLGGPALVSVGTGLYSLPAGLIVAGILLSALGVLAARRGSST